MTQSLTRMKSFPFHFLASFHPPSRPSPLYQPSLLLYFFLLEFFNRQGLTFLNSTTLLYSSGYYGESSIRLLDSSSFETKAKKLLSPSAFGEGCDVIPDIDGIERIYQLTWKERKMYVSYQLIIQHKCI